jgi:calcyclin binding protein
MNEKEECELLLKQATFSGIKDVLQKHLSFLKILEGPVAALPIPVPAKTETAVPSPKAAAIAAPPPPVGRPSVKAISVNYIPISDFAWDQGEYNSNTVSVFIDLPGVGAIKDNVDFSCTKSTFDLKILGLEGKNYRLIKDNLDKDIIVDESKIVVKKDKIVIKLRKVKGEYSYENWANLTGKKKRDASAEAEKKSNPMGGIMDMMKDMYEDGDDSMKKIIGEAMMKSQRGEKSEPPSFDDKM